MVLDPLQTKFSRAVAASWDDCVQCLANLNLDKQFELFANSTGCSRLVEWFVKTWRSILRASGRVGVMKILRHTAVTSNL